MAAEQSMAWAIMQVTTEATKVAIMAVRVADNPVTSARPVHTMPRSGGLALRQPMFDLKAAEKYQELCNFEIKVKNTFMINYYNTQESRKAHIILNKLCQM